MTRILLLATFLFDPVDAGAAPAHGITLGVTQGTDEPNPVEWDLTARGITVQGWRAHETWRMRGEIAAGTLSSDEPGTFGRAIIGIDRRHCAAHDCFGVGADAGLARYAYAEDFFGDRTVVTFVAPTVAFSLFGELTIGGGAVVGARALLRAKYTFAGDYDRHFQQGSALELYAGWQFR